MSMEKYDMTTYILNICGYIRPLQAILQINEQNSFMTILDLQYLCIHVVKYLDLLYL